MDTIFNGLNHLIDGSARLAALGAGGVLVFFNFVLIIFIAWLLKNQKEGAEKSFSARIKESEDGVLMANAVAKLADELKEIRHNLKCIGGSNA